MDSMENLRERLEVVEQQMRAIEAHTSTVGNTLAPTASAQIIREMIRHEDNLTVGRTNWMITLQGLLFAALAFSWEKSFPITVLFTTLGLLFSIIFVRYLNLSNLAIRSILDWWNDKRHEYNGPPVIGRDDEKISKLDLTTLPWKIMPYSFIVAWIFVLIIKLIK